MESFGPLFREMRQNKGFKLSEVAEGIMSVQFLRKFEKGLSDVTLTNFFLLLEKINVTFEEFMFEKQYESLDVSLENLEKRLDKAIFSRNSLQFAKLLEEYEAKYQATNTQRYLHFMVIIKFLSNKLAQTSYKYDETLIPKYLRSVETWGRYEFFICNYSLFEFTNQDMMDIIVPTFQKKITNQASRQHFIDYLLQICFRFINDSNLSQAEMILELLETSNLEPILQYMPFKVIAEYLKGLIQIAHGDKRGEKKCQEITIFFNDVIDFTDYAGALYRNTLKIKEKSKALFEN